MSDKTWDDDGGRPINPNHEEMIKEQGKMLTMQEYAKKFVAVLTKDQLIDLDERFDDGEGEEFMDCIRDECMKVAPELFGNMDDIDAERELIDRTPTKDE